MSYEPEPRNGKYMDEDCYREGRKDKDETKAMTIREALLDTAFTLNQLSERGSFYDLAAGRVLKAEVKRLRAIAEQVEEKEYEILPIDDKA